MTFNNTEYTQISNFIKENSQKKVQIIAVSKNHPYESVKKAIDVGVRVFGENRVQEALSKFVNLKTMYRDIELHLTGSLQTKKVKTAIKVFDVFQTLDREKLAKEFSKYPKEISGKKFFIQVNTGKEASKSGVYPNVAKDFINFCREDLDIPILGLMCIPPADEKPKDHFDILKKIAFENNIVNLSMGMSSDYREAILCGASYIRVGTKLFGERFAL